jgi:hypothetical protein
MYVVVRLRKAGIRVLGEEEWIATPGVPALMVDVNVKVKPDAFMIRVGLVEWVSLDRGFKIPGAIWSATTLATTRINKTTQLRGVVGDLVDKFINDYLASNPKN